MAPLHALAEWLNIRPPELRRLGLSVLGAFLVLSFMILARSLREAFFLTLYEVERLPWMIVAVVVVSLPAVGQFGRLLGRRDPRRVVGTLAVLQALGLLVMLPFLPGSRAAVVAFYLWTAVGSLLATSGFWVVVADLFPIRGAKRLFSLIGAGGTAGAMVTGISLGWLTQQLDLVWLVAGSAGLLLAFGAVVVTLRGDAPPVAESSTAPESAGKTPPLVNSARLVWNRPQLRGIALVVFCGTLITTLLDYQFKDLARAEFTTGAELVAFFGSLYGWAGLVALVLQLLFSGRLLERTRISAVLAVAPALLVLGGAGLMFAPVLALATGVRGADYALRKALYRPAIEVLFVPVPAWLRRQTKTFIDSLVDAAAEGAGSLLILLWVSALGLPARHLAALVIVTALAYLLVLRRLDREYLTAVGERLREEGARHDEAVQRARPPGRDLLSATFTNLDLSALRQDAEPDALPNAGPASDACAGGEGILAELTSFDDTTVLAALDRIEAWNPDHLEALERLIARDTLFRRVIRLLQQFPDKSVPPAVELLRDEEADFTLLRRIPDLLARVGGPEADDALVISLTHARFEVRYRSAVALASRRRLGLPEADRDWRTAIWHAISLEVRRDRPLWELHKLLDSQPEDPDDLVVTRVGVRGEYSLEHTFRLLSLVLDPEQVRAAYHGVVLDDDRLKSYALEYLEHVLPRSVRHRLWGFIGDLSERRKEREARPLDAVVADLMVTGQTLFQGDVARRALERIADEGRPRPERQED